MQSTVFSILVSTLLSISLARQSAARSSKTLAALQPSQADIFSCSSWLELGPCLPQILEDHLVDSLPRQSRDQVDTMGAQGEGELLTSVDKTLDRSSKIISDMSSL